MEPMQETLTLARGLAQDGSLKCKTNHAAVYSGWSPRENRQSFTPRATMSSSGHISEKETGAGMKKPLNCNSPGAWLPKA